MPSEPFRRASLGLGGNIGDPVRSMAEALQALDAREDCHVTAVSRLYRTPPWGKTDQDWFFNACALVETTLAPEPLLDTCLAIERDMKRERKERWGPRTIDIDLIRMGERQRDDEFLTLPHPRAHERAFVLVPWLDADPAAELPGHGSVADLVAGLDTSGVELVEGATIHLP